jgi:hypothetical protein
MPSRILSIGRRWPITPVDMTRLVGLEGGSPVAEDATSAILIASSSPPFPVTALAQPELTTMLRIPVPFRDSSTFRETCTGAAWNLLVVNTAAPFAGISDATNAMSGFDLLDAFTPTCTPDAEKPLGYVPDCGTYFCLAAGIAFSAGAEYARVNTRRKLRPAIFAVLEYREINQSYKQCFYACGTIVSPSPRS